MLTNKYEESLRREISDHGVRVIDLATLIASEENHIPVEVQVQGRRATSTPKSTARLIRDMLIVPAAAILPTVFPAALKACLAASGDYDVNHNAFDIKNNMTEGEKALGIFNAVSTIYFSSFIITNAALPCFRVYISQWEVLRAHCATPLSKAAYTLTSMGVTFALTETTFQFAKIISPDNAFPVALSLLALPTFFIATDVAVNNIHARLLNAYTIDSDTKYKFANLLTRIDPKYKITIERMFNEVKLVADSLDERAEQFALRLIELAKTHSDLFAPAQSREQITKKGIVAFNVASVVAFAIPAFIIMTQKGFNSANTTANLFNEQNTKNDLFWVKLIIGLLAGFGATPIFASSGIEARHIASDLLRHLKTHKRQIPRALIVLTGAAFASTAMYRTARESLTSDNLFEIPSASIAANMMAAFFTLATVLIYFSLILKVPAKAFANFFAPLHPNERETTVAFFVKQLRHSDQIISRDTATAIRELTDAPDASIGEDIEAYFADPDHDEDDIRLRRRA